ncbi:very-long-chain 3-oxoacyl-CoA reductase isoform X1 [Salmo salar]|uniref:Very-long-chain 3-oxoacyl-CoA reductase isoform X1 n=1 Tax=Salmo salar TaxID=8030 RepID=A0A1S3RKV1_SALSA|nr:very-long-chain 3-oxoacyl-CoA reductase isoform X1 [Salmo salar]|eukprot:XP_014052911.1 PREDICTED: very-long-chain 3-oxoacyl-CoA reductase-like isoform X1 [Salmo salar]
MDTVSDSMLARGLVFIGGFTVLYYMLKWSWICWCGFRVYVLSKVWQTDLKAYGQWAVVTGATSGIGKAYANELAKRGLDIVLVSRSKDKLHIVAKEIESQHGRQTQIIQTDFTEGHDIYPAIAEALRDLDIGILVNNVGMNYSDKLVHFLDIPNPEQRTTQVINCNILSVTQMTRLVLPRMVARGNGLIINMSSEAGAQPQPMLSLYSATKIFVTYFSRSLNSEYKSQGITVQCVAPFMVSTNMTHNLPPNLLLKSASAFAREALNTVGYSSYTSGCVSHALQHIALSIFFPDWLRLSSYCVKQTEKFAQSMEKKMDEMTERSASKED